MPISLLDRKPPSADHRIKYGAGELQFADLRLPLLKAGAKAPVVVFLHGGWWQSAYDLEYGTRILWLMGGIPRFFATLRMTGL